MEFKVFKTGWNLNKWQIECPELTYRVIKKDEIPRWLPDSLINKFNTAVIASSGNTETYVGIIMGYRIDNDKIKEHPFVVAFNKNNNSEISGLIEHGNWSGRTTNIPSEMERLIKAYGLTIDFNFTRKPDYCSGTIEDLKAQGILNGYEKSILIIEKQRQTKCLPITLSKPQVSEG